MYGRFPSVEELSAILHISPERVVRLLNLDKVVSLDQKDSFEDFEEDASLISCVCSLEMGPEEVILAKLGNERCFEDAKEVLSEKEYRVLEYFFGYGGKPRLSYAEIGRKLGVSRECVRQIGERAIRKLRSNPNFTRMYG